MKPFDLEAARRGAAVCTRDGRNVRIVCFDMKNKKYSIIILIDDGDEEQLMTYTSDGKYINGEDTDLDLFMKSVKKEGWINIYPQVSGFKLATTSSVYSSEWRAKSVASEGAICVRIEWEE